MSIGKPRASLLAAAGCIRSRLLVTSEPSGAAVKIEGKDYGDTPVSVPFIWYWYYKVEIRKDGFEPVTKIEHLRTPPWLIFPLDFFAELIPYPITDTRHRDYVLKPAPLVSAEAPTRANWPGGCPATAEPFRPCAIPAMPAPLSLAG